MDPFNFDLLGFSPPLFLHIQALPLNHAVTGQQLMGFTVTGAEPALAVCASSRSLASPNNKGRCCLHFVFNQLRNRKPEFNCSLPGSDARSSLLAGVFQNNGNKSDVM